MADTVRDVHVSAPLSNFSIGYHPMGMVAEQTAVVIPVQKENDVYYVWNQGEPARPVNRTDGQGSLRADGSPSLTDDFNFTKTPYLCEEYALNTKVTDRQVANADSPLQLQWSKTRRVQDKIMLDQEIRVASLLTTAANWSGSATLTTTNQWNDPNFAGSIEKNFDDGRESVRQNTLGMADPNQTIIPKAVAMVVKRDAKVRDLIKYTQPGLLVNGDLPPYLWTLQVVIPKVAFTTTIEGETPTFTDVWGKHVVIHYRNPNPGLDDLTSAAIFRSRPFQVYTWREDRVRANFFEPSVVQTEVVVAAPAGYVIRTAIS